MSGSSSLSSSPPPPSGSNGRNPPRRSLGEVKGMSQSSANLSYRDHASASSSAAARAGSPAVVRMGYLHQALPGDGGVEAPLVWVPHLVQLTTDHVLSSESAASQPTATRGGGASAHLSAHLTEPDTRLVIVMPAQLPALAPSRYEHSLCFRVHGPSLPPDGLLFGAEVHAEAVAWIASIQAAILHGMWHHGTVITGARPDAPLGLLATVEMPLTPHLIPGESKHVILVVAPRATHLRVELTTPTTGGMAARDRPIVGLTISAPEDTVDAGALSESGLSSASGQSVTCMAQLAVNGVYMISCSLLEQRLEAVTMGQLKIIASSAVQPRRVLYSLAPPLSRAQSAPTPVSGTTGSGKKTIGGLKSALELQQASATAAATGTSPPPPGLGTSPPAGNGTTKAGPRVAAGLLAQRPDVEHRIQRQRVRSNTLSSMSEATAMMRQRRAAVVVDKKDFVVMESRSGEYAVFGHSRGHADPAAIEADVTIPVKACKGWRVEAPATGVKLESLSHHRLRIIKTDSDMVHYRKTFYGRDHTNWIAVESLEQPVVVSVREETLDLDDSTGSTAPLDTSVGSLDDSMSSVHRSGSREPMHLPRRFRVLVRTQEGTAMTTLEASAVPAKGLLATRPTAKDAIRVIAPDATWRKHLKQVNDPKLTEELVKMEDRLLIEVYKMGILYVKPGQTENEMFANKHEEASADFLEFLNFLGETVRLKGWEGFAAGLDTKRDNTGTHSVFAKFDDFEVMFHVSTLLPFNPTDTQHLQRKRHLGNDIVVIAFLDGEEKYSPDTVVSQFNHILCAVQKVPGTGVEGGRPTHYRIGISAKDGVGPFGPDIPAGELVKGELLRAFLFTRLINGERASYEAAGFKPAITRTRRMLLQSIVRTFGGRKYANAT